MKKAEKQREENGEVWKGQIRLFPLANCTSWKVNGWDSLVRVLSKTAQKEASGGGVSCVKNRIILTSITFFLLTELRM